MGRSSLLRPAAAPLDAPPGPRFDDGMCRSIKTLRPPYTDDVTPDDVGAAALQYVRKIAGMRAPAAHNREAFDTAVQAVADATAVLLRDVQVRAPKRTAP